jgi:hypothetical protein
LYLVIFYYQIVIYLSLSYHDLSPAYLAAVLKKAIGTDERAANGTAPQESGFSAGLADSFFVRHRNGWIPEFINPVNLYCRHLINNLHTINVKDFCLAIDIYMQFAQLVYEYNKSKTFEKLFL